MNKKHFLLFFAVVLSFFTGCSFPASLFLEAPQQPIITNVESLSTDIVEKVTGTYLGKDRSVLTLFPDGVAEYYHAAIGIEKDDPWKYEGGKIIWYSNFLVCNISAEYSDDVLLFSSDSKNWQDEEYTKISSDYKHLSIEEANEVTQILDSNIDISINGRQAAYETRTDDDDSKIISEILSRENMGYDIVVGKKKTSSRTGCYYFIDTQNCIITTVMYSIRRNSNNSVKDNFRIESVYSSKIIRNDTGWCQIVGDNLEYEVSFPTVVIKNGDGLPVGEGTVAYWKNTEKNEMPEIPFEKLHEYILQEANINSKMTLEMLMP